MSTRSYEDLDVYRAAFAMLKPVHDLALRLPDYEKFDLANQMRRACKSIPTNIAEGYGRRRSPKEFCSFLSMALGSANEMEVHLRIARELSYIDQQTYDELAGSYSTIAKQLSALIRYWRSVEQATGQRAPDG